MEIIWILGSVTLISVIALVGIFTLSLNAEFLRRALLLLVGLAAGALIGDALIHLMPEALEKIGDGRAFGVTVLAGILFFFTLERYLRWHHGHHGAEEEHEGHERFEMSPHPTAHIAPLVLVADGLHNITDGVIIASSFLVSIELGIATAIAVILHEIPQEIGDFGLLTHAGYTRAKALFFNFLSGLTALGGAIVVLLLGDMFEPLIPYVAAFTAGSFLYIAIGDIFPELHKSTALRHTILQVIGFSLGIAVMLALTLLE